MVSSLSNLVDNFLEILGKIKCKDCDCFLEYDSVNNNLKNYKYLSSDKHYSNKIDEELKNSFKNTFKFSNNDINKFILFLRKGVYPHEFMDNWENLNKTLLPEKEEFYSNLNMENITDSDYNHAKRTCYDFEVKNSYTLLLANAFEKFRIICLEIYFSQF